VASLIGPSPTRDTPRLSTRSPHPSPIPNPKKLPPPPLPIAIHLGPATPRYYLARALSYTRPSLPRHLALLTVAAQPLQIAAVDGSMPHLRVSVLKPSPHCYPTSSNRRRRQVDVMSAGRRRRRMDAIAAQPRSTPHPSGVSESTPPPDQHQIWQRQDAPRRRSSSVLFGSSTGDQHLQRAIRSQV
jgi:hypothetical protein